jgi:hypothetical protein
MTVGDEKTADVEAIAEVAIRRHTEQFIVAEREGVPPEVFFALSSDGAMPQVTVAFHPAFMADA